MKKLIVLSLLLVSVFSGFSQEADKTEKKAPVVLERKNVFKFLPINTTFHSLSFEYERMLSAKNSITFGFGLPSNGKLDVKGSSDINSMEFSSMHLRLALRHYTGKSQLPRGFYVEPYLKYQDITASTGFSGTDQGSNQPYTGDVSGKLNTMNIGLQFGTQILIAKRVTLDFYFLGIEAGLLNGNISGSAKLTNTSNLPANPDQVAASYIVADINTAKTDNLPSFISDKITVSQDGNRVNTKINGVPYPWLRAGISLGIAF